LDQEKLPKLCSDDKVFFERKANLLPLNFSLKSTKCSKQESNLFSHERG